ncbi:MAG: ABC transporter substrate-binding protein [Candidatus Rokubacteria bacterium]|nr:ABC transporter substrate-binding protein [Candidatus Rokubacteria bacterium]
MNRPDMIVAVILLNVALAAGTAERGIAAAAGELVVAQDQFVQRFDPLEMVALSEYPHLGLLFDGLFNLGPNGQQPALATDVRVAANGLSMDFILRKGVRFHNGDPFTGEDVQFTYEQILSPKSTHSYRKGFQETLAKVQVVDPYHVRFHLKKPWPTFFTAARNGIQPIVPKRYYERVGPAAFKKQPVGTGPFRLEEMKTGEWTRFTATPDYWGARGDVRTITLRLVSEPLTRFAMLTRGEADMITGLTGQLLKEVRGNPSLKVILAPHAGTSYLTFNRRTNPEFNDRRVRLSVAHAVDRPGIVDAILNGVCEVASEHFTPATFGHAGGTKPVPYDPDRSRALLKEAGFTPGQPADFVIHTQSFAALPSTPQVLEAIAGNLEAVGFRLRRQTFESGALLSAWRSHAVAGISYGVTSIPDDGGLMMDAWFTSTGVFSNEIKVPAYDGLFNRQLNEASSDKRRALLQEWSRMEAERLEAVSLFWCGSPFGIGPRVKEWRPGLGSG